MNHTNPFKILFIEDLPSDVDMAVRELRKTNFQFEFSTVCTKIDLQKSLSEFKPDLIISDYMMPSFNGIQALKVSKEFDVDLPFILCTGSINEEVAVECMKAGAIDYVTKQHMSRLPFAVKDALAKISMNKEKTAYDLLLKENEAKLQSIFTVSPVGIGLVVNRVLLEVNDTLCNLTGYKRSELIGKSSLILYSSKEEFDFVGKEKYEQILEHGTGTVETKFKRKNGTLINVVLSSAPLDRNDLLKGVTFTVLDITLRNANEIALRESENRFRVLYNEAPVGLYRTNRKGEIILANNALIKMLKFPSFEELAAINLNSSTIGTTGTTDNRKEFIEKIEREGEIKDLESIWICYDGKEIFVRENANLVRDENGNILYYDGTVEDITERKLSEKALKESEEKYRGIFENVQDLFYEIEMDGTILEVSPSIKTLSKGFYRREDLIGRSIYDFYFDPDERSAVISQIKVQGTITDFEITLRNGDGSLIPCSLSSKIIFDAKGCPEKIIGSIHDITDRKNASNALKLAKEKAEMSDRLKTDFLNNISHEVRTPLNGILGFAEIIFLKDLSEQEKKDSHAMLLESSNRLLNTITNFMDISIITSGSLSVTKKNFSPAIILRNLFENFKPVCLNRNLELFLELPEKCNDFYINSDPEICRKIVTHFLDNAVKFTEKGSIHFGFSRNDGNLQLFVKDTGIGIKADSFNIIFERFVKDTHGPSGISEGSGLGLSIARGMAEAIGGKISLESEPGVGSIFILSIPVAEIKEAPLDKSAVSQTKAIITSPILVAEDDETNFYYLNTLLNRETDSNILHASNGEEAVMLFKANPDVELILMDMKMPQMDGFEATRQIKLINKNVHIIAITAYAMSGDEDRVMAAGCDGYLSKPINRKSLLDKIGEFIKV